MPNYRDVYLEKKKTLDDSGSLTIDISPIDPISEMVIRFEARNGSNNNKSSPIPRVITKIEIIDGADVVYSMDGRLAYALSYYLTRNLPHMFFAERGDATQFANIPLRFGRWLWDPTFALDPLKFRNLQLRITWDLAAVNAVGTTGFLTGSAKLSVVARVMEGLPAPPSHFLMHKDHYAFTTGASGEERVALPNDYPYIMAMVRAFEAGVQMSDSLENIKLSLDFDKAIPIDITVTDLKSVIINEFGTVRIDNGFKGDNAEAHEAFLGDIRSVAVLVGQIDIFAGATSVDAGRYTAVFRTSGGVDSNNVEAFVNAFGQCPFNCLVIPFGNLDDPETYLMAQEHGDIKAILTQGNAGAEANVVLSQLRMYKA